MKSIIVTFAALLSTHYFIAQNDPSVMEIDGKPVTKDEFLRIYTKNNPDPKYDKASLDEYMQLFTKFKLKVPGDVELKMGLAMCVLLR